MKSLTIILFACACNSHTLDYDHYATVIQKLATDPHFVDLYNNHIKQILELEPNYFNYTPFGLNNYKFECQFELDHNQSATSVHRLQPKDIKVGKFFSKKEIFIGFLL